MQDIRVQPSPYNFAPVHQALQRYVDADVLAGVSSAVLHGRELVDLHCAGWANKEQGELLRSDHIFRIFSNSKLVTSCAVLLLWEEGRFGLDAPIDSFIPQLAQRQVLRPGATRLNDTEPARSAISIRHLLSHSAGLSYGLLDPGTMVYQAYSERKVLHHRNTLDGMMDKLADLPLLFHPGTAWEYSVASDVLGRLVEVVSGQPLDAFLQSRIFAPLGMVDTGFVVPLAQQHRLATLYHGANVLQPLQPGLKPSDTTPFKNANLEPSALLSGGGGLVSTLPDMLALLRSLLPGGPTLLKADTLALMVRNQLPAGCCIRFAGVGELRGMGFGLGGAVMHTPSSIDPPDAAGEFQWGGMAGTHWWISPERNLAGLLMAQRWMGFWHPFALEFKQQVYAAVRA